MASTDPTALRTVQKHRAVIEAIPSSKRGLIYEPAVDLSPADRSTIITSLGPTDTTPSLSPAATTFIDELSAAQRATTEARLERIAATDDPTPFEAVTHTELAYGFSDETLTDSRLVSEAGVGVSYVALHGLLEEAGVDPDDALPSSLTDPALPISPDSLRSEEETDLDSLTDISELMADAEPIADALRHQLKYVRDCFFLRQYHEQLIDELSVTRLPKLVWPQPALDVQNDTDPFASDSTAADSSDSSVDTTPEWLHQEYLPEHLKPESSENTQSDTPPSTETTSQAGLNQF